MNFYLIIPVSSVEIGGRFTEFITTGASIYHIYQTHSKTGYNVYRPSYFSNRYPWPRKKLTRKTLDMFFHLPMFCKIIKAEDIDELARELNIHSDIYKVVI
jgi:hypothetical protein